MTKLLDNAVAVVRQLPPDDQDDIARAMLALAEGGSEAPDAIDPAHLTNVIDSLGQVRRGQFASDAEVAAAFRRFD